MLATNVVLLCLVALTVICLTRVVGLILVIALLSLPAATAAHHVARLVPMMIVATILAAWSRRCRGSRYTTRGSAPSRRSCWPRRRCILPRW